MTSSRFAASISCAIGLLASPGSAQQPRFTSATDVVPLYVTATSGRDRFATDLTIRDFTVLEDGQVRPISQFESGPKTVALSVLVDESPSASDARARTQAAAREMVRNLRPGDLASIGAFASKVSLDSALTGDPDVLMRHVQALAPVGKGTALWDAIDAGISAIDPAGGRRVVVVLTDGVDNASSRNAAAVRDRLTRSGAMLYVIGFKGREGRPGKALQEMARQTGGSYVELGGRDSVEKGIRQVMNELHHQYLLGFSPSHLDGRVHSLAVRVSRRGLTVKSRSSYVAGGR
jgi:VWFA-related protein